MAGKSKKRKIIVRNYKTGVSCEYMLARLIKKYMEIRKK